MVALDALPETVATPAMTDAITVDVLVGWGSLSGPSQVNMTPGTPVDIYR